MITEYHIQFLQETAAHMDLPLLSERPANKSFTLRKVQDNRKLLPYMRKKNTKLKNEATLHPLLNHGILC